MPLEIERKFLVTSDAWRERSSQGDRLSQGYLAKADGVTVRVRQAGRKAWLTIKGDVNDTTRQEFEYEIPVGDAEEMLGSLCQKPLIEKVRRTVRYNDQLWYVDVFEGRLKGIVIAEVELAHPDEPFEIPNWIGREITSDLIYRNSELARLHKYEVEALLAEE